MSKRTRTGETADQPPDDELLLSDTADDLRTLADRINDLAGSLPIGPARHHARRAAVSARTTADEDASIAARRAAVGELVTELRTAADEAEATRSQYELLQLLYEEALPVTREASADIYA
jgi:hypothetical protein